MGNIKYFLFSVEGNLSIIVLKYNTYTVYSNKNLQILQIVHSVVYQWRQTALCQSHLGLRSDLSLNNIPFFIH